MISAALVPLDRLGNLDGDMAPAARAAVQGVLGQAAARATCRCGYKFAKRAEVDALWSKEAGIRVLKSGKHGGWRGLSNQAWLIR